jgi:hypothetical protein
VFLIGVLYYTHKCFLVGYVSAFVVSHLVVRLIEASMVVFYFVTISLALWPSWFSVSVTSIMS